MGGGEKMYRNLMIRFSNDGEYFREIDEERHYFLYEAEKIILKIKERLQQQKRSVQPKEFECWIDGQKVVVAYVSFDNKGTLEKQLETTMLEYSGWEDEVRYTFVNKLKEYAEEERQLFLNKEFKAFAIRFDQVFGHLNTKPFAMLLGIKKLKQLFDEMSNHVTTGFYSELEEMMGAIKTSCETIVLVVERENAEDKKETLLIDGVNRWLEVESNFQAFVQYVAACYQSVSKKRIEALCSRFKPYQDFQLYLFKQFASVHGFSSAYQHHIELQQKFIKKYDDILFQGFVLKTDDMVESLVLNPVINKYQVILSERLSEEEEERKDDNEG